jgi:glutamate carboxypeptidase
MVRIILFVLLILLSSRLYASTLNPLEHSIRSYLATQQKNQIALLKKLVEINSGTTNIKGVSQVAAIMRRELQALGFSVHMIAEPKKMQRASTLIAERHGKGQRLLLIGHLDTVFAKESAFQHYESHSNTAKGPGVIDDKGGLVVLLYALKAMQATHTLNDTDITIVLTGDEEDSGKPTTLSRAPLIQAAKNKDIALDFEPSISLATATIARRGISNWKIETQGNQSHSATIFAPDVGAGAIFELARILNEMRQTLQGETYLSFNPGLVLGGTTVDYNKNNSKGEAFGKQNVVSRTAIATGDLRYVSIEQKNITKEKITKIVEAHLPATKATVSFEDGIPAMASTEQNLGLLKKYSAVSLALDQGEIKPLDPGVRGAGDISYIANIVPANLSGLGPTGMGAHSIIESIDLSSLPIQTERAAIFIYRLTRQSEQKQTG